MFPACDIPAFASRQLWFDHELAEHILFRTCAFCRTTIRGRKEMLRHIQNKHQALFVESQRTAVVESCEEVNSQQLDCPLCHEFSNMLSQSKGAIVPRKVGYRQLRSHLGQHLQYIALIALPSLESEDSAGETDTSIHDVSDNSISDSDEKLEAQESKLSPPQWNSISELQEWVLPVALIKYQLTTHDIQALLQRQFPRLIRFDFQIQVRLESRPRSFHSSPRY